MVRGNDLIEINTKEGTSVPTPAGEREKVERAYGVHAEHCPVYRSISAIAITTELDWRESESPA